MKIAGKYQQGFPNQSDVLIAATPEEMRGILYKLKMNALRKTIPADAFTNSIYELSEAARSPNYIGRNIRNTLQNPFAKTLVDNPDIAEGLANSMVGQLDQFGFDSGSMRGLIGPGMDILRQAKKDNLFKPDVSDELVAEKIQRPLYSAFQDFLKQNRNNEALNQLIIQSAPGLSGSGTPIEIYGNASAFGIAPQYRTEYGGTLVPLN